MNVKPSATPYFLSCCCVSACTLPSTVSAGASYSLAPGCDPSPLPSFAIRLIDDAMYGPGQPCDHSAKVQARCLRLSPRGVPDAGRRCWSMRRTIGRSLARSRAVVDPRRIARARRSPPTTPGCGWPAARWARPRPGRGRARPARPGGDHRRRARPSLPRARRARDVALARARGLPRRRDRRRRRRVGRARRQDRGQEHDAGVAGAVPASTSSATTC